MNPSSSLYREISGEEIRLLMKRSLGADNVSAVTLLKGGLFNTSCLVEYGSKKAVFRLGPVNRGLLLGFEENLMAAEQYLYPVCAQAGIPCPRVLACDTTKQAIDRDYIILDYIDGSSLLEVNDPERKKEIYEETGRWAARLHSISGTGFGRVSDLCAGRSSDTWAGFLEAEIGDILSRAQKRHLFSSMESRCILEAVKSHRDLLNEITTPRLVHCDLWEGNILVSPEGKAAALIDADRAVFGDVDFEFASPWMTTEDFMRGYGMDASAFQAADRVTRRKLYLLDYYLVDAYVGGAEYNRPQQYMDNKGKALKLAAELMQPC